MSSLVFIIISGLVAAIALGIGLFLGRKQTGGTAPADLDKALKDNRQELGASLKLTTDSINQRFDGLQTILTSHLELLRKDNHQQLERMRQTVDEKLQSTLEKRLTASFQRVDQQLEAVNKNMGEMQSLATDVGQLQKTLAGVKTRGLWGEMHLANLLAETLNPEQYEKEFKIIPKKDDKVDFALKIPSASGSFLYLPIDAKFPLTKFEALMEASENHQSDKTEKARKALMQAIKVQAKSIAEKYIKPPVTTDFAVMYLPLESLYAEVARQTDLMEDLRLNYKITLAGPSTILPMLGMLNMGYRSLAIQKRVAEVWQILTETQVEFANFGSLMDKAKKKIDEVGGTIEAASSKTRRIESKFKKVQRLKIEEDKQELGVE